MFGAAECCCSGRLNRRWHEEWIYFSAVSLMLWYCTSHVGRQFALDHENPFAPTNSLVPYLLSSAVVDALHGPVLLQMDIEALGMVVLSDHHAGLDYTSLLREFGLAEGLAKASGRLACDREGARARMYLQSRLRAYRRASCQPACWSIPRSCLPSWR